MQWYCIADGKQQGPMSEDELRRMAGSGALKGDDLVWNESMGDQWAEVSTVPELILPTGPPVLPSRAEPVRPPPPGQPGEISLTGPVGRAWARMVDLLFRPFDLGLWFTLGFSAWLSQLGQGGGSFNMPGGNSGGGGGDVNMGQAMEQGAGVPAGTRRGHCGGYRRHRPGGARHWFGRYMAAVPREVHVLGQRSQQTCGDRQAVA